MGNDKVFDESGCSSGFESSPAPKAHVAVAKIVRAASDDKPGLVAEYLGGPRLPYGTLLYTHPQENNVEGVNIPRLPVGTPVQKVLGYPFPGTVVAAFHTLSGHERFVVEATGKGYRGMLHIFNGDQLRALAATAAEGSDNGR